MTGKDHQRLKILLILLGALVSTFWIRQINPTPVSPTAQTSRSTPQPFPPMPSVAEIEVAGDWMIGSGEGEGDSVRRNPFQYGPAPPPLSPEPPAPGDQGGALPIAMPALVPPPPPPPIPFKYNGYTVIGGAQGQIRAFLSEEDKFFLVTEAEVLMGRYRVNRVTKTFVEVEDLEFGRRQQLPLIVQ